MLTWRKFREKLRDNDNARKMFDYYLKWGDNLKKHFNSFDALAKPPKKVNIIGMGGSGIVGYIIKDLAMQRKANLSVDVYNTPYIPEYRLKNALNILVSHSGNTREVLEVADKIRKMGREAVIVTSNGILEELATKNGWPTYIIEAAPLPRLGLPQLLAPTLKMLSRKIRVYDVGDTVKKLDKYVDKLLPKTRSVEPYKLANIILTRRPIIYYPESLSSIAIRFKAMLNENSKHEAYTTPIPEIFHNQIEMYTYSYDPLHTPYILDDGGLYPKVLREFLVEKRIYYLDWIYMSRRDVLYSLLQGIVYHDLISIYLSVLKDVDPYTTPSITLYKELVKKW